MGRERSSVIQANERTVGAKAPAEPLWSAADYAVWRGCSVQAAAHERCRGSGPPFIKVPGRKRVYYDPSVVRAWFAQHQVNSTAEVER